MASNAATECGVCNEEFDEDDRIPRCLPCIHTICSDCIHQLILRNKKACPFCRQCFSAKTPRDMCVNSTLVDVLKLLRETKQKAFSANKVSSVASSKWREEFIKENEQIAYQNISAFKEAQKQIDADIMRNNDILNCLLQANKIIKDDVIVKINEIVTKNEEKVRYLQKQNQKLQGQKRILKEKQKQADKAFKKLAETNTSKHTGTIFDEIEDTNADVQTMIERFKEFISEYEKVQNHIHKTTENIKDKVRILQEILNSVSEDEDINLTQDFSLTMGEERAQVTIETLRTRTQSVMELLQQGSIFALQNLEGKQRFAKLSVCEEDRICLHYLKEETLHPDAYILKQNEVMTLVNSSSRLAFIELSNERKEKLGRMYIRLSPQTKRADQFSLMCTGELGPTYANTKCLGVNDKDSDEEYITFGDYEHQDGTGGKALLPGVCEWDDQCMRPWLAGTVDGSFPDNGEERATQFYINTRTIPGEEISHAFGIVEVGLQVLTEAKKNHPNITDVIISDCGLVLEI